jgi:hypothetical protein
MLKERKQLMPPVVVAALGGVTFVGNNLEGKCREHRRGMLDAGAVKGSVRQCFISYWLVGAKSRCKCSQWGISILKPRPATGRKS